MDLVIEFGKFIIFSLAIVAIAKYLLVRLLRNISQSLNLGPRTVGNIAGIATSVPELLTVSLSAISGLISTSIYNILTSNIINVIQYTISIIVHKNQKMLKNKALKIDLGIIGFTIIVPIIFLVFHIPFEIYIVPIFLFLFIVCYAINLNAHKLYLKNIQEDEEEIKVRKKASIFLYSILLLLVGIMLYWIGEQLGKTLENLSYLFNIPEVVLGMALGFITSLPELITFLESQRHHNKINNEEKGVIEATNNLLASNVLNIFIIQSIGILLYILVI